MEFGDLKNKSLDDLWRMLSQNVPGTPFNQLVSTAIAQRRAEDEAAHTSAMLEAAQQTAKSTKVAAWSAAAAAAAGLLATLTALFKH